MTDLKTLVWLASYPKSGNTWLRGFLANYLFHVEGPAGFEHIQRVSSGDASAASYRELAGRDPHSLPLGEHMQTRHRHLARIAQNGAPVNFVKTHAPVASFGSAALIPHQVTRQAIYLLRHPLDMLVSYADHWGIGLEAAAGQIGNATNSIPASGKTVVQFLGSWSDHVNSWTETTAFPVLTLRYEDMLRDPEAAFEKVLHHIGAPVDKPTLRQAIEHSSFDTMAALETETGFDERSPSQERFFRTGKSGQWRELVPATIADKVVAQHSTVMRKFGYLE